MTDASAAYARPAWGGQDAAIRLVAPLGDKAVRMWIGRSILAPLVAWRWAAFIAAARRVAGVGAPSARELAKPLRSYLDVRFGPHQRLHALLGHHAWAGRALSPTTIHELHAGCILPIAEIAGRRGETYRVTASSSVMEALQREGEITLTIADSEVKLARLTFLVARIGDADCMVIGGLQGPPASNKKRVIDATRNLHGLRPKDAILLTARALAEGLGLAAVHAVSDRNHVLARLQDKTKFSAYDAYWEERGAAAAVPFGFAFAPMSSPVEGGDKRERTKSEIAEASRWFASSMLRAQ